MDVDYLSANADNTDQKDRAIRWSSKLRGSGLGSLAGVLLDVLEPLGPLGAQLLWMAQPALSLVTSTSREDVNGLAQLLEDSAGIAWLRSELGEPGSTASDGEDQ